MKLLCAVAAVMLLAGCTSSGGVSAAPSISRPAVATPDSLSCADWQTDGAAVRRAAAEYFAVEYNDPQPSADAADLAKIITTTCAAYGSAETPRHIAKVSVATIYG